MENEDEEQRERPINSMRRRKLQELLRDFDGPKRLAERAGVVDTHLTTIKNGRRGLGDALATKLEAACDKPFGWMDADPEASPNIDQLSSRESLLLGAYRTLAKRASSHEMSQLQSLLNDLAAVPDGSMAAALTGALGGMQTALAKRAKQSVAKGADASPPNPSHRPSRGTAPKDGRASTSRRTGR